MHVPICLYDGLRGRQCQHLPGLLVQGASLSDVLEGLHDMDEPQQHEELVVPYRVHKHVASCDARERRLALAPKHHLEGVGPDDVEGCGCSLGGLVIVGAYTKARPRDRRARPMARLRQQLLHTELERPGQWGVAGL